VIATLLTLGKQAAEATYLRFCSDDPGKFRPKRNLVSTLERSYKTLSPADDIITRLLRQSHALVAQGQLVTFRQLVVGGLK